jgi:hypothetical protein
MLFQIIGNIRVPFADVEFVESVELFIDSIEKFILKYSNI